MVKILIYKRGEDETMESLIIILYIYSFVIGCCVASFVNVVIYRVPRQISITKGRSFCPNCYTTLAWYDLIPIFSWLFLKRKCRRCKAPISFRYPLIEILGGILGVFCFYHYQFNWMTILSFSIAMVLLAITIIDFDTMTIPNGLVITMALLAGASYFLNPVITLSNRIIGMCCVSGFMLVLSLCVSGAFGGGDIKLMFVVGFLLGWENTILAFFIAILIAGIYAIYLLMTRKKGRKQHIAFGPYLCFGIGIALLYGNDIINWYLTVYRF